MSEFFLRALGTLFLCGFCILSRAASGDALKRPMVINKVSALGLEIWTEANPEWEVRMDVRNGQRVFIAESPALAVPPAGMSWVSSPDIVFAEDEIEAGARGAIRQVAFNYGVHTLDFLALQPANYGKLTGYESQFSATAHGTPVDVKVFCGHLPGKPAVLVHAFTLKGKLGSIGEHIRRSWSHLSYLQ